ncbi:MAG: hypothetical protein PHX86_08365 [Caldisericia bacterium]|jgi:hypothetical protein|nr:hypothetical protein [Caldisericia bacterium]
MSIKKTVRRYRIDQEPNNYSYWITKTPQERIDALETIRSEYHAWRYSDAEKRFHRVYRIVKQKQGGRQNIKSTGRSQDQADLENLK